MTKQNPIWMQTTSGTPTYSARLDRQIIINTFTEGVLSGWLVSQRAAGVNMTLDISAGTAVIYGDDQANQGAYLVTSDGPELSAVTIAAAPGSNSRIDLVYARVNDPNAGGPSGLNFSFGVVTGTSSASPAVPALPTSAIPLATVLIATGQTSVVNSMITDARIASYHVSGNPPGVLQDYAGTEASVDAGWLLCAGQAVSRTTYFGLFRKIGTLYGAGDGSTTFNVPDYRGRIAVGLDNMNGTDAGRLSMTNTLGGTGGEELHALTVAELAQHNHTGTTGLENANHTHGADPVSATVAINDPGHAHGVSYIANAAGGSLQLFASGGSYYPNTYATASATTGITASVDLPAFNTGGISNNHAHPFTSDLTGSSTGHNNLQPYMLANKLIKT